MNFGLVLLLLWISPVYHIAISFHLFINFNFGAVLLLVWISWMYLIAISFLLLLLFPFIFTCPLFVTLPHGATACMSKYSVFRGHFFSLADYLWKMNTGTWDDVGTMDQLSFLFTHKVLISSCPGCTRESCSPEITGRASYSFGSWRYGMCCCYCCCFCLFGCCGSWWWWHLFILVHSWYRILRSLECKFTVQ